MRALLIALLLLTFSMAEENPYDDNMEEYECYAETGMNCEESAQEWADENEEENEE